MLEKKELNESGINVFASGFENSHRKVQLIKAEESYHIFKELIQFYGTTQLIEFIQKNKIEDWKKLWSALPFRSRRSAWSNIGGQLMPKPSVDSLIRNIHAGKIKSWDEVHDYYNKNSAIYDEQKFQHAFSSLLEILKISPQNFSKSLLKKIVEQALATKEWMVKSIYDSRAKDYHNDFRKMVYDNKAEMEKVMGKLEDNVFINQQKEELKYFKKQVADLIRTFQL